MAAAIVEAHRATSATWPQHVSAPAIVRALHADPDFFNLRPAVIAFVCSQLALVHNQSTGLSSEVLIARGVEQARQKIEHECMYDLLTAFQHMESQGDGRLLRQVFALLSAKKLDSWASLKKIPILGRGATRVDELMELLVEPDADQRLVLLPPYAAICRLVLSMCGNNMYYMWNIQLRSPELSKRLRDRLVTLVELVDEGRLLPDEIEHSGAQAMMELAKHGIGILRDGVVHPASTPLEMDQVWQIRKLLEHRKNQGALVRHDRKKTSPNYRDNTGYHVIRLVRNVCMHTTTTVADLTSIGFPPAVLDQMLNTAILALTDNERFTIDPRNDLPVRV